MRHNLLPKEKKKDLRTEYIVRALNVMLMLLTSAVLLGATALIPAYVKVNTDVRDISILRDKEAQDRDTVEFKVAEASLAETAYTLQVLYKSIYAKPVTDIITEVLSARAEGIFIEGFSFERETGSFVLEGTAATRDSLVTYRRALESLGGITDVASPISNLAKNADLPFQLSFVVQAATTTSKSNE